MTVAVTTHDSGLARPSDCNSHPLMDRMAAALRSVGCRCEHNVPYIGCAEPQIVTRECARCRCLREYAEMSA